MKKTEPWVCPACGPNAHSQGYSPICVGKAAERIEKLKDTIGGMIPHLESHITCLRLEGSATSRAIARQIRAKIEAHRKDKNL